MSYLITYAGPGGKPCCLTVETPVKALHSALDLRTRGFLEIGLSDLQTGAEYGIREFARAHDLAVIEDMQQHAPSVVKGP